MLTIVACDAEGKLEEAVTKDRLTALLNSHGTTVWVDLCGPIGDESGFRTAASHVPPRATEDRETRRPHPKTDDYGRERV